LQTVGRFQIEESRTKKLNFHKPAPILGVGETILSREGTPSRFDCVVPAGSHVSSLIASIAAALKSRKRSFRGTTPSRRAPEMRVGAILPGGSFRVQFDRTKSVAYIQQCR
jgi:hypothetical protein